MSKAGSDGQEEPQTRFSCSGKFSRTGKNAGYPTIVTHIDAKKAYDTVWREGNYVRLFDAGMQGKMWRQIQAMGGNLKSKVRLSVGETQWHDVKRGVAQGAVESPWLYSCFIDGMTAELKKRNLGVMLAGLRIASHVCR